ncbi:hypothetical protein DFH08DRAFT_807075 [Mycena albidolilacea]|uniref:Uncharacterized protein n=1 Tax=Mycena albidolilacea TaxID=1033008 RepID=A0AAD7EUU5_9AGAR|nr:hypothetical protein DFH08DRAFT_807075 [Mycena albidolilacea]
MSSTGWQYAAKDLTVASENFTLAQCAKDVAEKEMQFKSLVLLHCIVSTHAELTRKALINCFTGDSLNARTANMEFFLCIAMVQSIMAKSKLHQDWTWNLFNSEQLSAPIPGFIDTYDFYNAYDQELSRNPQYNKLGYFLVSKTGEEEVQWVEVQDGTTLHCGISGSHVHNRFMREVFKKENISLPKAYQDLDFICSPTPMFEDDHMGFLGKLKKAHGPSTVPLPDSLICIFLLHNFLGLGLIGRIPSCIVA